MSIERWIGHALLGLHFLRGLGLLARREPDVPPIRVGGGGRARPASRELDLYDAFILIAFVALAGLGTPLAVTDGPIEAEVAAFSDMLLSRPGQP